MEIPTISLKEIEDHVIKPYQPTCSLCGEKAEDWIYIKLNSEEEKHICPKCLWKALVAGYVHYNTYIDDGSSSYTLTLEDNSEIIYNSSNQKVIE